MRCEKKAQELESPQDVKDLLASQHYLADEGLATAVFLALDLAIPLLLEGEPGVGKTEAAKALAAATGRRLIRLQCYEGIDSAAALYEWDYARQLLHLRAVADTGRQAEDELFSPRYLLERPLLSALRAGQAAVLLIDEVDRSDDAFEAFLLELLSDFQITIPELGTVAAPSPPVVVLTSNRTRELHDALRRRCLYHWLGYPSAEREVEIVLTRAPFAAAELTRKVVAAVHRLREMELAKPPGVAETIDWVASLDVLGERDLTVAAAGDTLGAVIKDRDDLELVRDSLEDIVRRG